MAKESSAFIAEVTLPDGRVYCAYEDITKDWHYYSKSWHNACGPRITVANRRVEVKDPASQQFTVVAKYNRWPNKVKGVRDSSGFLAILKCLPDAALPTLMGSGKVLDDCVMHLFAKTRKS